MNVLRWWCCWLVLLGAAPSRTQTYTAGEVISQSEVTENEDNIFSYLQAGVDTYRSSTVTSAAIADGAVGASEIDTGAVDVVDMATTGTAADDKAFIADSSSAGTWRTISNCTDSTGNHLNYTQSTNSFSCGTTMGTSGTLLALTTAAATTPAADTLYSDSIVKGWVMFDSAGTIAVDVNVSSITDNSTGDWTVNWATAFATLNYAVVATCNNGTTSRMTTTATPATGSVRIFAFNDAGTAADCTNIFVLAIGDN